MMQSLERAALTASRSSHLPPNETTANGHFGGGSAMPRCDETALGDTALRGRLSRSCGSAKSISAPLVENSSDVTALLNAAGIIEYVTPAALERLLGYRPDEFVGRVGFDFVHPDDVAEVQRRFGIMLADPAERPTIVCRVRHRDGAWRHLETVACDRLTDPAVQAVVVNFRDVTEREETLAALRFGRPLPVAL